MHKVLIIDTDIGTDVDDAIALFQIIKSQPQYTISVTTVYGDVFKRAKIASNYCRLLNVELEIYPGERSTLSGKEIWISGLEGTRHTELEKQQIQNISAFRYISNCSTNKDFAVDILSIAPLTNLAKTLEQEADFCRNINHVYFMGGRFEKGKVEHNIASDIAAAQIVLQSDMRMDVVGIEMTSRLKLKLKQLNFLKDHGPAEFLLHEEINQWAKFWSRDWIVPHDSIGFLMKSNPELFTFSQLGDIRVRDDGQTEFVENEMGSKRIVIDVDVESARSAILKSLKGVKFAS